MLNSTKSTIPSMEQRKSQINLLNFMEQEKQQQRRDSKEFLFPDDNLLHKRRPSSAEQHTHSATQSEDDENSASFEVMLRRTHMCAASPKPGHVSN